MPRVGFEPTIPVLERPKTVRASGRLVIRTSLIVSYRGETSVITGRAQTKEVWGYLVPTRDINGINYTNCTNCTHELTLTAMLIKSTRLRGHAARIRESRNAGRYKIMVHRSG